jgi:hypothetical protein
VHFPLVSSASGRRADVNFDTLELALGDKVVKIGWLFPLIASLKKKDDSEVSAWLETTHVSQSLRLGRGNRGSIFILSKK